MLRDRQAKAASAPAEPVDVGANGASRVGPA